MLKFKASIQVMNNIGTKKASLSIVFRADLSTARVEAVSLSLEERFIFSQTEMKPPAGDHSPKSSELDVVHTTPASQRSPWGPVHERTQVKPF